MKVRERMAPTHALSTCRRSADVSAVGTRTAPQSRTSVTGRRASTRPQIKKARKRTAPMNVDTAALPTSFLCLLIHRKTALATPRTTPQADETSRQIRCRATGGVAVDDKGDAAVGVFLVRFGFDVTGPGSPRRGRRRFCHQRKAPAHARSTSIPILVPPFPQSERASQGPVRTSGIQAAGRK